MKQHKSKTKPNEVQWQKKYDKLLADFQLAMVMKNAEIGEMRQNFDRIFQSHSKAAELIDKLLEGKGEWTYDEVRSLQEIRSNASGPCYYGAAPSPGVRFQW